MLCYNGGTSIAVVATGGRNDENHILLDELFEKFKEDIHE